MARALAAQASRAGRKVSFFMRKGADVLSKWVGEAERQLRLLFEEARRAQPSIIFFDEIDGLAPVRLCHQAPSPSSQPHPKQCCHLHGQHRHAAGCWLMWPPLGKSMPLSFSHRLPSLILTNSYTSKHAPHCTRSGAASRTRSITRSCQPCWPSWMALMHVDGS